MTKYHAEGDESSQLLQYEMAEIEAAIETEKLQALSSWMEWFRTSANRYRLFIIVTSGFIIQWCGSALISYYIHLVFNSIGITDSKQQLILNGGVTISGWVWGSTWSLLIDKMGRRPMWLVGMSGMFVAFLLLTVFTGVNTANNYANVALGRATIFTIFLFGFFYKMPGCMLQLIRGRGSAIRLACQGIRYLRLRRRRGQHLQRLHQPSWARRDRLEILHRVVLRAREQLHHHLLFLPGDQKPQLGGSRPAV